MLYCHASVFKCRFCFKCSSVLGGVATVQSAEGAQVIFAKVACLAFPGADT